MAGWAPEDKARFSASCDRTEARDLPSLVLAANADLMRPELRLLHAARRVTHVRLI